MNVLRALSGAAVCLLMASGLAGCGDSPPEVAPVTGTVMYQGKPVDGAAVTFTPANGRPATGQTNANGEFTLTTFKTNDGAITEEHAVTIAKMESGPVAQGEPGRAPPVTSATPPKSLIPKKYSDPRTSGLKETVASPGPNEFTFDVED